MQCAVLKYVAFDDVVRTQVAMQKFAASRERKQPSHAHKKGTKGKKRELEDTNESWNTNKKKRES